jgi:ABC-type Fe3+ transport system substrate-binding protein
MRGLTRGRGTPRVLQWVALVAVVATGSVGSGCGASSPTGAGGRLSSPPSSGASLSAAAAVDEQAQEAQRLLAAAQAVGEAELNLSWSDGTLGGREGVRQLEALFNRTHGTNIRFNFTPGPSFPDVAAKVTQELAAGRKATTDVLISSEGVLAPLVNRELLEEYDYTLLSPRITPEFVAPRNTAVEVVSLLPGLTYNTELVSAAEAPRSLEQTLQPRWKGRIASTPYATGFERVAMRPEWGADRMRAFVVQLSEQIGGLIRSGEESRLVTGEFVMLVMDTGAHQAQRHVVKGAPLQQVIPPDAGTVGFLYLGVPRNSGAPNLAKLFINTALSEAGQQALYETAHTDHHALAGSRTASKLRAQGVDLGSFLKVDAKFVAQTPEMRELSAELQRILNEKSPS